MGIRVDIQPQFKKIANWYWDNAGGYAGVGMSIWEMLERDFGAKKVGRFGSGIAMVTFPNGAMYTAFLLRWA
jgi:hypothetical protein